MIIKIRVASSVVLYEVLALDRSTTMETRVGRGMITKIKTAS
jgi:hypothetical protein